MKSCIQDSYKIFIKNYLYSCFALDYFYYIYVTAPFFFNFFVCNCFFQVYQYTSQLLILCCHINVLYSKKISYYEGSLKNQIFTGVQEKHIYSGIAYKGRMAWTVCRFKMGLSKNEWVISQYILR